MGWTDSRAFRSFIADSINRTEPFDLNADQLTVALFNNTGTPDLNAASASTAYNTGAWVVANEVSQVGQWAAGGVDLTSVVVDTGTAGVVFLDAADTQSGNAASLSNVFGCLVYDNTVATPVANQGICYNYFGGAQQVTSGIFKIAWAAGGILRFTL